MRARPRHARAVAVIAAVGLLAGVPVVVSGPAGAAEVGTTIRVSLSSANAQGDDDSSAPSMSADGRLVAFTSSAGNLVDGDAPLPPGEGGESRQDDDVFVRDRRTGQTTRVSVGSDGAEQPADSDEPAISADGRHVAFTTEAAFDPADTGQADIYVRDLAAGQTRWVSRHPGLPVLDAGAATLSGTGRLVAYEANVVAQVPALAVRPTSLTVGNRTVRVVAVGAVPSVTTVTVDPPTAATVNPGDCPLTRMPPGTACDLQVNATAPGTLVIDDSGVDAPHRIPIERGPVVSIAAVACCTGPLAPSAATADIGAVGAARFPSTTVRFTNTTSGRTLEVTGRTLAPPFFADNGCTDAVLRPQQTCTVTVFLSGGEGGPRHAELTLTYGDFCPPPSPGGADCPPIFSQTTEPVEVFGQVAVDTVVVTDRDSDADGVFDEPGGTTTTVLGAPGRPWVTAFEPNLAGGGAFVAFSSVEPLVPADENDLTDVYRAPVAADVTTSAVGAPELVSATPDGAAGDGSSRAPSLSADGNAVAFESSASDLTGQTDPAAGGVFVRDVAAAATVRVPSGDVDFVSDPVISADARSVAYQAVVFVGGEDADSEIEVADLVAGTHARVSLGPAGEATAPTDSREPAISADGRFVGFSSRADVLVDGDTNEASDVFVRDRVPVASIVPEVLDFGDQPVGHTSGPLPVQITNTGSGPMTVGQLTPTGPDASAVLVDNTCLGVVLFPGETCTASVRVTPPRTGPITAGLELDSTAATTAADVTATGVVAVLAAAPSPLDLGPVGVGTTGPARTLTVTNTGPLPLRVTGLRVTGPDTAAVVLPPGPACPTPLAPGASCAVTLRLAPQRTGPHRAALVLTALTDIDDEPAPTDLVTLTVPLTGDAVAPGLVAAPNPLRFAAGPVAQASPAGSVTVRAVGARARITGVSLAGLHAADFTLLPASTCRAGVALPPNGTCRIAVSFAPAGSGPRQATVLVTSADGAALVVTLLGAGADPTLVLNPRLGPPGTVVHVTGSGWTPSSATLSWTAGIGGALLRVDAAGRVDGYALVLPDDSPGPRSAEVVDTAGLRVSQPFLVVPQGTAPPQLTNTSD